MNSQKTNLASYVGWLGSEKDGRQGDMLKVFCKSPEKRQLEPLLGECQWAWKGVDESKNTNSHLVND